MLTLSVMIPLIVFGGYALARVRHMIITKINRNNTAAIPTPLLASASVVMTPDHDDLDRDDRDNIDYRTLSSSINE